MSTPPSNRDWASVRHDFPALHQTVHDDQPLAYLDNAASRQMPEPVIERIHHYQRHEHANVHRGVHELSQRATEAYETARERVAEWMGAPDADQCIFTRGATEAINLVAQSWGRSVLEEGDEVLLTELEHHANIVPWQQLREEIGITLRVLPVDDQGEIQWTEWDEHVSDRTRLVALTHASNVIGTINPVDVVTRWAHRRDIPVLVDGCQAVPHQRVDVEALDVDFYACSAHKMGGPTGVGLLYGKQKHLDSMPPYQGGGGMIRQVTFEESSYADCPERFEAGTPPIMPAIGWGASIDYLASIGMDRIADREDELMAYAIQQLETVDGLSLVGDPRARTPVLSMSMDSVHPHDVGTVLDQHGVAVRASRHCAHPLLDRFNLPATIRASLAFYNATDDIDRLVDGLKHAQRTFLNPQSESP